MEERFDEDDPWPELRGHETTAKCKSSTNSHPNTNSPPPGAPPKPKPLITNWDYERADEGIKRIRIALTL